MKYNETNVTCQVFNIVFQLANFAFARANSVKEKPTAHFVENCDAIQPFTERGEGRITGVFSIKKETRL